MPQAELSVVSGMLRCHCHRLVDAQIGIVCYQEADNLSTGN
jgi:hypothetical protein